MKNNHKNSPKGGENAKNEALNAKKQAEGENTTTANENGAAPEQKELDITINTAHVDAPIVTNENSAENLPSDVKENLSAEAEQGLSEAENLPLKEESKLGLDLDGTPKLSINETLNIVSKSIVHIFEDRKKTSLPKITPTEVEKLLAGYEGIKINWQFADLNKTSGRLALVSIANAQDHVLLPLDINEEWEFGVDYELMAREAKERGEEFGEKELAAAKAKHELDENDKNRLSIEHLENVAKTIENIFAERELTCLPKLTDKEVRHVLRNQAKTISIEVIYANEEDTEGYYELKEFLNIVRVPAEGNFAFSIDNERVAKKLAESK